MNRIVSISEPVSSVMPRHQSSISSSDLVNGLRGAGKCDASRSQVPGGGSAWSTINGGGVATSVMISSLGWDVGVWPTRPDQSFHAARRPVSVGLRISFGLIAEKPRQLCPGGDAQPTVDPFEMSGHRAMADEQSGG